MDDKHFGATQDEVIQDLTEEVIYVQEQALRRRHFNGLTPAEQERLVILAEECAEVQQVIAKALRHGLDSDNNGKNPETNRQMIERELGDLLHSAQRCFNSGDLTESVVEERRRLPETKGAYLHYQSVEPAQEIDVFGRPECIYNYCPHPAECQKACAFPGEL